MPNPRIVLTALAELAPAGGDRVYDVAAGDAPLVFVPSPDRAPRSRPVDRLAALDALHREERALRLGIGFLLGTATIDGTARKIRLPLLTRPVRLERSRSGYRIVPAGDLEVTPLVTDPAEAARFESVVPVGDPPIISPEVWLSSVAAAIGLSPKAIVDRAPRKPPDDGLLGVTAAALFVAAESVRGGVRGTLRDWAARPGLEGTALAAVYGTATAPADDEGVDVLSPLPLNPAQRHVVRRARHEPVTVVSGPPGNGKSHAVVAAALDSVARGGSVLVATQSTHAASVLCDLFARYPGPTPIAFGDAERRAALSTDLGSGTPDATADRELREAARAVTAAAERVRGLEAAIGAALAEESAAAAADRWQPLLSALAADVPGAFDPAVDLATAGRRLAGGRIARWWARRRLRTRAPAERIRVAIEAATSVRAAARLATVGGTRLPWEALADADAALAAAVGAHMEAAARGPRRWTPAGRRAAQSLAGALRAGRNRRRELLAGMDAQALIGALPLWVGTVTDVEDLLPPVAGVFDLVILDEASHIDQLRAAPVLARARRALIVGDPRQLRFVSFTADVEVADALARHGLDDRVDVRRMSAFDVASGAAAVTWLSDHHRSGPHLIGFSAHRFYDDRFTVATRHPRNETTDAIDVVAVPPARTVNGVVRGEVDAVLEVVAKLDAAGATGIGVVTPFRAQADALEAALLGAYDVTAIERLGLRVGTVHAFQGSEAPVVVISLGLCDGDARGRIRFASDPNLFNVMVTRGRERVLMVSGLTTPTGLIADYLAYAERGPAPPGDAPIGPWGTSLAAELRRVGVQVRTGYPVGPHLVDLCAGDRGLVTEVHPDGPAAHLARQRALRSAGWSLVDAFASRWSADPVRAALDLANDRVPTAG